MRPRIEVFGLSDRGKVRGRNQDQFLIADLARLAAESSSESDGHVLVVADGMGGHAAGGEASEIAVETIRSFLVDTLPGPAPDDGAAPGPPDDVLRTALEHSHEAVLAAGRGRPERTGMGTTLTVAYVVWPSLYLAHVGDSRCYLLRGGSLRRITHDHTYAQRLVDTGGLTADQAEGSFLSNVLTRVIGGDTRPLEVDVHRFELEEGDTVLLSTDGLAKHVSDAEIHRFLEDSPTAEEACRRLVSAALDRGGTDNVTVVVARFPWAPSCR